MMSNENTFNGQWEQLKGKAQQTWGELTDDDVERINGERRELVGILKEKYGRTEEQIESEVADFLDGVNDALKS
jgi:uncharacterized protein YjbJ (UPF0337 family)